MWQTAIARFVGVLLVAIASDVRAAADCFVACDATKDSGKCELMGGGASPSLSPERFAKVDACDRHEVSLGAVLLRYRHKKQWFVTPRAVPKGGRLAAVFALYPADACSVPTPQCIQQQMSARGSGGGHGVDSQAARPAGNGSPCTLGLPCGRILPPAASWQFRLEDDQLGGRLIFRVLRGTPPGGVPAEFEAPVSGGRIVSDGSRFTEGGTYGYRLLLGDGSERASGEFSVLSRFQAQFVRTKAEEIAAAGTAPQLAWIDALASNDLDWDAYQAMRRSQ